MLGELYATAAPGRIGGLGGSKAGLVTGGVTLQAHAVSAEMREVVPVPMTVLVCRSDAFGCGLWRRLPSVEVGKGSAVSGFVRL